MSSSTLSLTSPLDTGGLSTPRPSCFIPGKETRYLLYRRLGGPQGRSGQVRNISPPPEFEPRTIQPVASRYTDWAIQAHLNSPSLCHKDNSDIWTPLSLAHLNSPSLFYKENSDIWMTVSLASRQVQSSLYLLCCASPLSSNANILILVSPCDFCLMPA